jgi:hypothetical protein
VQLLDLTVPAHLGELPHPRIKGAHSPLKQLLLPRANLVGADLVALRQISHARLLPHRLQAIFALSAASTFRLVLFVISRSVYYNLTTPNPINQPVPNSGATSSNGLIGSSKRVVVTVPAMAAPNRGTARAATLRAAHNLRPAKSRRKGGEHRRTALCQVIVHRQRKRLCRPTTSAQSRLSPRDYHGLVV